MSTIINPNTHITFIGGGNMGRALISGLITNGFKAEQITVVEANKVTAHLKDYSSMVVPDHLKVYVVLQTHS